jgi:hypothetical protein
VARKKTKLFWGIAMGLRANWKYGLDIYEACDERRRRDYSNKGDITGQNCPALKKAIYAKRPQTPKNNYLAG